METKAHTHNLFIEGHQRRHIDCLGRLDVEELGSCPWCKPISFYIDPVHSAASTLGRLGGQAKSPAKSTSSRENGRKGGRPKKEVAEETVNESNLDLFK